MTRHAIALSASPPLSCGGPHAMAIDTIATRYWRSFHGFDTVRFPMNASIGWRSREKLA